ncbi:MAG: site-specific integrase [Thermoplasmatota archaeon]
MPRSAGSRRHPCQEVSPPATPGRGARPLLTLWDCGHRFEELLGCNVGQLDFDGEGVRIWLRPDQPRLKTGPREVYGTDCAGPLRHWLDLHPAGQEPEPPLFPGFYDVMGRRRLSHNIAHNHTRNRGKEARSARDPGGNATIHPHDSQHTCATRKSRLGWQEDDMRRFFGWKNGSRMPGHYSHKVFADMRARVLADHSRGPFARFPAPDLRDDRALLAALRRLLAAERRTVTSPPCGSGLCVTGLAARGTPRGGRVKRNATP